jgi:hypothetical protein
MRHLESRQLEPAPLKAPRRKSSLTAFAAVTLALILAGGFGMTRLYPPIGPDVVTTAENQERTQAFAREAPLQVAGLQGDKAEAAIAAMDLPAPDKAALRNHATQPAQGAATPAPAAQPVAARQQQPVRLIELMLWDTHAADGDVVRVIGGGLTRDVLLTKSPTVVHVPDNGSGVIQVVGVKDGGGGITLGIKGAQRSVLMPIMSEGQTLSLPVAPQ